MAHATVISAVGIFSKPSARTLAIERPEVPQLKREWSLLAGSGRAKARLSRHLEYITRADISEFESYQPSHAVGLCKPLRLDELGAYAQGPPQTTPVGIERLASSREQKSAFL
jgi:hypothetical protein